MKRYLFQLGNHPNISRAEISKNLPNFQEVREVMQGFWLYVGKEISFPQKLLDALGGTIRIAEVLHPKSDGHVSPQQNIVDYLHSEFPEGKIKLGLSIFGGGEKLLQKKLFEIKNILKKKGRNIRIINRGNQNLDAGTLHKEKIFIKDKSAEILQITSPDSPVPILAKTIATQDVEAFAQRDFHKPVRDMQVGMLPPKLALSLVNLASHKGNLPKSIWDPFCGTGTVLVEAGLLGIECTGSDISEKMVLAAEKNWEHFFPYTSARIFKLDATQIGTNSPQVDAIVSEGYLGPIFHKPLNEKEYRQARHTVESVMEPFLTSLSKNTHIQKVAFSLPFWKMKSGKNGFCEKTLATMGRFWKNALDEKFLTERKTLLFRRSNQVVGREIFVLERKRR